jgi:hypothetical protein
MPSNQKYEDFLTRCIENKKQITKGGNMGWIQKMTFFLIGMAVVLALLFLTGANSVPQIGRYQMEVAVPRDFPYVYIIDTSTGVVKWIDDKDEGKPFEKIKVK